MGCAGGYFLSKTIHQRLLDKTEHREGHASCGSNPQCPPKAVDKSAIAFVLHRECRALDVRTELPESAFCFVCTPVALSCYALFIV